MNEPDLGWLSRTALLIGEDGIRGLQKSRVIVFGLGGVGSFSAEALIRAGIGCLTIVDHDVIELSNLNRQLIATRSSLGIPKVEAMRERLQDINPGAQIIPIRSKVSCDNIHEFLEQKIDYVVDAIDDVNAKVAIIKACRDRDVPVVSAMGTGNRFDPTKFRVVDISDTHTCPLARAVRSLLRKAGILSGVKVVLSAEQPLKVVGRTPGSISFVPPVAGMVLASVVVRDLLGRDLPGGDQIESQPI